VKSIDFSVKVPRNVRWYSITYVQLDQHQVETLSNVCTILFWAILTLLSCQYFPFPGIMNGFYDFLKIFANLFLHRT